MSTKGQEPTILTIDQRAKLENLGRRVIEARLYQRRMRARERRILKVVHEHLLSMNSVDLQRALLDVMNNTSPNNITETEIAVEINNLR